MGKRSGIPHRDEELALLSQAEIEGFIRWAQTRLPFVDTTTARKALQKHIHWLEAELARRA